MFLSFFFCYCRGQFLIVKENSGNEGTCVGVSRWPVTDYCQSTTTDMWLYRAYSGNVYHNGEQSVTLPGYSQGDYITVLLDMDARTLSFGKNGEVSMPTTTTTTTITTTTVSSPILLLTLYQTFSSSCCCCCYWWWGWCLYLCCCSYFVFVYSYWWCCCY